MPWALTFSLTFLPSIRTVFVWRFGFQVLLVWRIEKLTLLPYCFPLPVTSHLCMVFFVNTCIDYRLSRYFFQQGKVLFFVGDKPSG